MKTRNGLVSNSSSSSFIVIEHLPGESKENIRKLSLDVFEDYYGDGDDEDIGEYNKTLIDELVDDNKCIIFMDRIENGAEEDIGRILKSVYQSFGKTVEVETLPN